MVDNSWLFEDDEFDVNISLTRMNGSKIELNKFAISKHYGEIKDGVMYTVVVMDDNDMHIVKETKDDIDVKIHGFGILNKIFSDRNLIMVGDFRNEIYFKHAESDDIGTVFKYNFKSITDLMFDLKIIDGDLNRKSISDKMVSVFVTPPNFNAFTEFDFSLIKDFTLYDTSVLTNYSRMPHGEESSFVDFQNILDIYNWNNFLLSDIDYMSNIKNRILFMYSGDAIGTRLSIDFPSDFPIKKFDGYYVELSDYSITELNLDIELNFTKMNLYMSFDVKNVNGMNMATIKDFSFAEKVNQ